MKHVEPKTIEHCTEDAITACLLGIAERRDLNHVDACVDCYARVERARLQVEELRFAAEKLAARPEHFWSRQRAAIMDQIAQTPRGYGWRWLWAPGAALAAVAVVLLVLLWPSEVRPPVQRPPEIADDVLLSEIQSDLARPVPRALEPATLLVRARNDMARANQQHSSQGAQK
jgi:hypothetical protein